MRDVETRAVLESIGANLRRLRLRAGLTQEKLAELVGMESRFTQRVLRGKVDISMSTLIRFAKALGVTPASLLRPRGCTSLPAASTICRGY